MRIIARLVLIGLFSLHFVVQAQRFEIGMVDYYGLRCKGAPSKSLVDACLQFTKGDTIDVSVVRQRPTIECLAGVPGVKQASINLICCTERNSLILFVGISDKEEVNNRNSYDQDLVLPPDIIAAYDTLMNGLMGAITSGQSDEDGSEGHALFHYPGAEVAQEKFIAFANDRFSDLRTTLQSARNEKHRVVASWVIAYHKDKTAVVPDLTAASNDPDPDVRNNAMRGLGLMIGYLENKQIKIDIDPKPFINLMNSVNWSDRNKSSLVLEHLTRKRDPALLALLRKESFLPLVDMATWQSLGHAYFGFVILGRMAGWKDEEIFQRVHQDRNQWVDELMKELSKN